MEKLLKLLDNIDIPNLDYKSIQDKIKNGEITNIKELLSEIQILKQVQENIKVGNYKRFLNEWYKEPDRQSFTHIKFWYKYKHEGRESIRNLLKGKEIEFHTNTKDLGVYKGRIMGLLPLLSKKTNDIKILFDTREYGTLEVDNKFPIIIRN